MEKTVFEYRDYKGYLEDSIASQPSGGRGMRSAIADALGCQKTYVSQVLNGNAHFSLEQADRINSFLGHSEEEGYFLLLLVQLARAGSPSLRQVFQTQINQLIEKHQRISQRLKAKNPLSASDRAQYYSSWHYVAVHVLTSIPAFQSRDAIARRLDISTERAADVLLFLVSNGLVVQKGDRFEIGAATIHLDRSSSLIPKHHTNWRMRAINSLDRPPAEDLHFSSVVTLSNEDVIKIKSALVDAITKVQSMVKESPEQTAQVFTLDFFAL